MSGQDRPGDGLELMADETRVEIIRELISEVREDSENPTVEFGDLRRRVGARDSGNFNYHLKKLEGQFLRDTGDGYRITVAGARVYIAIENGIYNPAVGTDHLDVTEQCPECDESLRVVYPDGRLIAACSNGHKYGTTIPSRVVKEFDDDRLQDLVAMKSHHELELTVAGNCPLCYAQIDESPTLDMERTVPMFHRKCPHCAATVSFPVAAAACLHPGVAQFFHEHGVDVRTLPEWAPELTQDATVRRVEDKGCLRVTFDCGETMTAIVDESLAVIDLDW